MVNRKTTTTTTNMITNPRKNSMGKIATEHETVEEEYGIYEWSESLSYS